jgi:cytochrome c oxidase subunit 2
MRGAVVAVVGGIAFLVAGCGRYDAMLPTTAQGNAVISLFYLTLALSLGVFLLILGLLTYVIMRFRRRGNEPLAPPSSVTGNHRLEVIWTVGPVITVIILFLLTVRTMQAVAVETQAPELEVDVFGNQWWWEFRYPSGAPIAQQVVTANELHLPVDTRIRLRLNSNDVQHDFWVPQFGWKRDMYPGMTNLFPIVVHDVGTMEGACAEYCGTQHAWMRIRVVSEPRAQFDSWLAAQQQPAASPTTAEAQRGQQVFMANSCVSCHAIRGTQANARVGPDLTHFGSRTILAAGVAENNAENVYRWVRHPADFKPGALMPSYSILPEADLRALAAYLESLK